MKTDCSALRAPAIAASICNPAYRPTWLYLAWLHDIHGSLHASMHSPWHENRLLRTSCPRNRRQYSQSGLSAYLALSGLAARYPWFIACEHAFTMAAVQRFHIKFFRILRASHVPDACRYALPSLSHIHSLQ